MLKISHKVLLGDFDAFDEVMHKDVTNSEFFIWILFFYLHSFNDDYNAESADCFYQ